MKLPYWLRGALLAVPVFIVLTPLTLFLLGFIIHNDDIIIYIAPELFVLGMSGMGLAGIPPQAYLTLGLIFLIRSFITGAVLGAIYEFFARKNKRKWFFILIVIIPIIFICFSIYRILDPGIAVKADGNYKECDKIIYKGIKNFGVEGCYKSYAIIQKDYKICDNIKLKGDKEYYKWYCYEEVAHAADDASICDLIPEKTRFNRNQILNSARRDGCFDWFKACDKIIDLTKRNSCYSTKAHIEKDPSICEKIEEGGGIRDHKDRCYLELKACDQIKSVELKVYCK